MPLNQQSSSNRPLQLLIVGGGTAGWMAANLIASQWPATQVRITVLESSRIGAIGVGEGTTPYFRNFMQKIGLAEADWMPECQASFKSGILFKDWCTTAGYQSYVHPFYATIDQEPGEAFFYQANLRRRGADVQANPTDFFLASYLGRAGLAPIGQRPLPFDIDYAYHFDAALLGKRLARHACARGVVHLDDDVVDVQCGIDGSILQVITASGRQIVADFYLDCSGFSRVLSRQLPKQQWLSYQNRLFNDSAVVVQTATHPMAAVSQPTLLPSQTESVALSNGWCWHIPLPTRYGNGYVFSRRYQDKAAAEQEFRRHCGLAEDVAVRHLTMQVGRQNLHWQHNCMAIGLSQGFIEPLEATALMLVQYSIELFCLHFSPIGSPNDWQQSASRINNDINQMFDGVADYVQCHYLLNNRTDTHYWQDARQAARSAMLDDLLQSWRSGAELELCLNRWQSQLMYFRPSWYCILAGMADFPHANRPEQGVPIAKVQAFFREQQSRFVDHRTALQQFANG